MGDRKQASDYALADDQKPAIRFLIESALRKVTARKSRPSPANRQEWVAYLAEALMSDSDASYQSVLTSLMANGTSSDEIHHRYIPDTARYLGELWVGDKASFVNVTTGAARLQALFRSRDAQSKFAWMSRSAPLGSSVLMVTPDFEDHTLGAFVAADDLRQLGLWVHMSIAMNGAEIVKLLKANRYSMLGLSLATPESVDKAMGLIEHIRKGVKDMPPVVIGGHAVRDGAESVKHAGADFVAASVREAIDLCGLAPVSRSRGSQSHGPQTRNHAGV